MLRSSVRVGNNGKRQEADENTERTGVPAVGQRRHPALRLRVAARRDRQLALASPLSPLGGRERAETAMGGRGGIPVLGLHGDPAPARPPRLSTGPFGADGGQPWPRMAPPTTQNRAGVA